MTELHKQATKEKELADQSIVITSVDEALSKGLNDEDIQLLAEEVSHSIGEYNHNHSSEMLPKPASVIYEQLQKGLSCIIAVYDTTPEENRWRFLHHASIYPVFEDGEDKILGTQIVEFGSAITHKNFSGLGLHTKGTEMRLKMMERFRTKDVGVFGISTVKRVVTGHTWNKFGVNPVSFWDHPYTSFLTNTCEGTSERYGHKSCDFRRSPKDSDPEILRSVFTKVGDNQYLPCTLLVSDHDALERFEQRCRELHAKLGRVPLLKNDINVQSYKRAQEFFDQIKKR